MENIITKLLSLIMALVTMLLSAIGLTQTTKPEVPNESTTAVYEESCETTEPTEDYSKPETEHETENSSKPETEPEISEPTCERHNETGVYRYENNEKSADMSVDLVGNSEENKQEFIKKFKEVFGFEPTSEIRCTYIGKYIVDDSGKVCDVYRYEIEDTTYPLLTDDFYVITRKICLDGSPWVGFCVPIDFYNEEFTQETYDLIPVMYDEFCDWTGYDTEYINANPEKFCVNYISVAGPMRTKEGKIQHVSYRYIRGIDIPVDASEIK